MERLVPAFCDELAMNPVTVPEWRGPAPKPAEVSVAARRLIDLANRVPAGRWVSYGDLAEAYVTAHGVNMRVVWPVR